MIDFSRFYQQLDEYGLQKHQHTFASTIETQFNCEHHGDLAQMFAALNALPTIADAQLHCQNDVSISSAQITEQQKQQAETALRGLIPWRKGPYHIFDTHIDTEWRSDWKWDRILSHLSPLTDRKVLDVGCGSGYHCWRMLGEGAEWVLGIDPTVRFVVQFHAIKHFAPEAKVDLIPLALEQMPAPLDFFDTVFSMGVLYHRTSPIDHIKELRACLRPGGELVLETLVVDGELGYSFVPEDRYAQMRNVWFLPSVPTLMQWLHKCGFVDIRCVDINQTSIEEQRTTEWMPTHSLINFLDENNHNLTTEGHPAPKRAVIVAKRTEAKSSYRR